MDGGQATKESAASKESATGRGLIAVWVFLGGLLYWLALPPMNCWLMGWLALVPWVWIILQAGDLGRRGWLLIWIGSFLFWMAELYFIPIPHWALWFVWPIFAAYLSLYFPIFLFVARQGVHSWRFPVWLVVPLAWAGVEWARAVVITGFPMAYLSHTQYHLPRVIQIADLGGAYFLSALMAAFATLVAMVSCQFQNLLRGNYLPTIGGVIGAIAVIAFVLGYGSSQSLRDPTVDDSEGITLLVIQGSIDTTFPADEAEFQAVMERQFQQYRDLTIAARQANPTADLVIWPETIFVQPLYLPRDSERVTDSRLRDLAIQSQSDFAACYQASIGVLPIGQEVGPPCEHSIPMLTGIGTVDLNREESFNSVVLIDEGSEVESRYDKNHRVLFGEYMPGAEYFPFLNRLTPVGKGIRRGTSAQAIEVQGIRFCPSVCFESTIPHLIRRHVEELERDGVAVDYLVNCTNDGWFFGTSCLDLHLACNVFRAVELRRPMIVAANTGFSAEIDPTGQIKQVGPRRSTGWLAVKTRKFGGISLYRKIGDWPWRICTLMGAWALVSGCRAVRYSSSP